jgi:hypothetical protein
VVGHIADTIPWGVGHMQLQAFTFKGGLAEFEFSPALSFSNNLLQAFYHQGLDGRPFPGCEFTCLFKNRIWNLYGRFLT